MRKLNISTVFSTLSPEGATECICCFKVNDISFWMCILEWCIPGMDFREAVVPWFCISVNHMTLDLNGHTSQVGCPDRNLIVAIKMTLHSYKQPSLVANIWWYCSVLRAVRMKLTWPPALLAKHISDYPLDLTFSTLRSRLPLPLLSGTLWSMMLSVDISVYFCKILCFPHNWLQLWQLADFRCDMLGNLLLATIFVC